MSKIESQYIRIIVRINSRNARGDLAHEIFPVIQDKSIWRERIENPTGQRVDLLSQEAKSYGVTSFHPNESFSTYLQS